jgi:hypothetical protein
VTISFTIFIVNAKNRAKLTVDITNLPFGRNTLDASTSFGINFKGNRIEKNNRIFRGEMKKIMSDNDVG